MRSRKVSAKQALREFVAAEEDERREAAEHTESLDVVPCIRLFGEQVMIDREGYGANFVEVEAPLVQLSFEYPTLRQRVRASDPQERFYAASAGGVRAVHRNRSAELDARRVLESFGALDVECLDSVGVPPDVDADYMVRVDADVHDCCAFTAYAVPQLRRLGWKVELDDKYPFQVVGGEPSYYANIEPDEERPDWFALELGVEVSGKRVSLMPVLLDLLDGGAQTLAGLRRGVQKLYALPVSETQHVAIQQERLRTLLRVLIELYEGQGEGVFFPLQRAGALEALGEVFGEEELTVDDPSRVRTRSARTQVSRTTKAPEPVGLKATLRPYQSEGLGWLQALREGGFGGILADDMGLGKTLQTIAHLTTEKADGRMDRPTLVVAPTSLMGNWAREIQKFAPCLNVVPYHGPRRAAQRSKIATADVVLTSYPILIRDEELAAQLWHFVVLDEAHTIKNRRSRVHQAAKALEARHRLCLTGTPVENHLGELWSLFDFLEPGLLGSELRFRTWFRTPIERYGDDERLLALRDIVAPYILRRVKKEVATELPPKTRLLKPVELSGKQRELYESIRLSAHAKVRNTIKKRGLAASTVPILDALMKLRQLCCDPRLVKMDAARFVRQSAKYEALFELVEQQLDGGHRILIFSQFTSMLRLISAGLKEKKRRHFMLTGATKNRQQLCDRFEAGEADVFLISLKAGGVGLNLVSADTVIHYDPWWNPQAQEQATDRAYRIGQTRPVFVYDLFVAGSVEERMLQLQQRKRRLADAILAGQLPADERLSEADVEVLFAPLLD
ncbi:MAG: DEAD/DEAH box helicase [Myxococcota bacterium]